MVGLISPAVHANISPINSLGTESQTISKSRGLAILVERILKVSLK